MNITVVIMPLLCPGSGSWDVLNNTTLGQPAGVYPSAPWQWDHPTSCPYSPVGALAATRRYCCQLKVKLHGGLARSEFIKFQC